MDKKLTKFDIMIALGFLFTLIVAVGAFFLGLQTGKDQTDARYKALMAEIADERLSNEAEYPQQQIVFGAPSPNCLIVLHLCAKRNGRGL